jgi:hypothetical protein
MADDALDVGDEERKRASFDEAIQYLRYCLGKKKSEVSRDRLATTLVSAFSSGYNGNHQPFEANRLTLHRGRITKSDEVYEQLSELWYPPKDVTSCNRANLPGESVFYCSSGNATSIAELRPVEGDMISMMTCTPSKDLFSVKWIVDGDGLGLHNLPWPHGDFERLCSEAFCRVAHSPFEYWISGSLGSLFFAFSRIDALAYSSIATTLKGVNLAIRAPMADKYVVPLSFRAYKVREVKSVFDITVQCTGSAGAPTSNGFIEWKELPSCPGHHIDEAVFDRRVQHD